MEPLTRFDGWLEHDLFGSKSLRLFSRLYRTQLEAIQETKDHIEVFVVFQKRTKLYNLRICEILASGRRVAVEIERIKGAQNALNLVPLLISSFEQTFKEALKDE